MNFVLLFVFCFVNCISGYFITVPPNTEECFFDRVEQNIKLTLLYEVAEGGNLDINVKVTDPNGKAIYDEAKRSEDKFTFDTNIAGLYKYCFSNKISFKTSKIVMFDMEIGDKKAHKNVEGKEDNKQKLERMISELSNSLTTVKHEQEYMEVRERIHRNINDNTNSRVVLWATFETFILIVMTLGQVYYLKRFFEVRRVI